MAIAMKKNNRAGFTLMELMIVIMILGGLMAMLLPAVFGAMKKARKGTAKTTMMTIKSGIMQYQVDTSKYPAKLKDLVERPKSGDEKATKKWDGPYLGEGVTEVPDDPWGERFVYKLAQPGAASKHPYELYSYGPNGKGSPKEEHIDVWD